MFYLFRFMPLLAQQLTHISPMKEEVKLNWHILVCLHRKQNDNYALMWFTAYQGTHYIF